MKVLGQQAAEREQIIIDRLKEYVASKESDIFHIGDVKNLCSEFYEDEIEVAFTDIKHAQIVTVAPGYAATSPRYYQFPEREYPKKENPIWLITVYYDRDEKPRYIREVECDGKDFSLDLLGLFKLGSMMLKAYIRTARETKAFDIRSYWDYILNQRAGWGHLKEGYYYTESRGDFQVRLQEVKQ